MKLLRLKNCMFCRISNRRCATISITESKSTENVKVSKRSVVDIPGPRSFPVIGTGWIYSSIGPYSKATMSHSAREELYEKYGSIYKEQMGGANIVSIHDSKDIVSVLNLQGRKPIRIPNEANIYLKKSRPDLYNSVGLVDSNGDEWLSLRKKTMPSIFTSNVTDKHMPAIQDISQEFSNLIQREKNSKNEIGDIRPYLFRFGLEAIWKCCIGENLGTLTEDPTVDAEDLIKNAENLINTLSYFSMSRDYWKLLPSPTFNLFRKSDENMYKIVGKYVDKKIQGEIKTDAAGTILDSLIAMKNLDKRDVKSIVVDFITAGITTTAYTISFLLHELGKKPEIQKLIQEDLDALNSEDLPLNFCHRESLLKATIKEGFRLVSPIPMIMKVLEKPITLQGYEIPPMTPLLCQTRVACREEENFSMPLEFLPERWLSDKACTKYGFSDISSKRVNHTSYLLTPFGRGARMCIGERLAQREVWVLVAKILQKYTIKSEGDMKFLSNFLLVPAMPVKLAFHPR